jgi:CheY-like chemotaxis protein
LSVGPFLGLNLAFSLAMVDWQEKSAGKDGILRGLTVLVVEDDVDSRSLFELVFMKQAARVLSAEDGFAALAILQTCHVDVIVSDIGLPDLNGYDLLKKIRALEDERNSRSKQTAHVPAVAVSAYADPESKRRALEAGFQLHISKPTKIPELVAAVAVLGRKKLH